MNRKLYQDISNESNKPHLDSEILPLLRQVE